MPDYIVVLNDGETFSTVHGSAIYEVPDEVLSDPGVEVDEELKAGNFKVIERLDPEYLGLEQAGPLMRAVLSTVSDRGSVTVADVEEWIASDDDNDPWNLYFEYVASAVNSIEDEVVKFVRNREEE